MIDGTLYTIMLEFIQNGVKIGQ